MVGERQQRVMYYTSLSQYSTNESSRDYIIEGVGSVRGPFDNLGYRDGTSPIYLAYCQVNNDIIFYNEYSPNLIIYHPPLVYLVALANFFSVTIP